MTGIEIAIIAGTVLSAVGSIQQGIAASNAAKFNAKVAQNNAIAARQNAAENARRERRLGRLRQGARRAASGAFGNIEDDLDLLEDNAREDELAALTIIHQGELQAISQQNQASLFRSQGSAALTAGFVSAAGTLIGGGGRIFSGLESASPNRSPQGVDDSLTRPPLRF